MAELYIRKGVDKAVFICDNIQEVKTELRGHHQFKPKPVSQPQGVGFSFWWQQRNKKMEDGIQDRIDGYAEYIGAMAKEKYSIRVCSIIDAMKINSPIEQLYVATLLYAQALGGVGNTIKIIPQFKVGKYRVDFCLIDTNKSKNGYEQTYQILVELDSYQFHNRNPKQHTYEKKREREIQKSGYQVIRFSGGEVISDPEKCVTETLEVLYKSCAVAVF